MYINIYHVGKAFKTQNNFDSYVKTVNFAKRGLIALFLF